MLTNYFLTQGIRGVFLDIVRAFDKVSHEGLFLEIKMVFLEIFLKLLRGLLPCRKQRVVLIGQPSSWDNVTAGVPKVLF